MYPDKQLTCSLKKSRHWNVLQPDEGGSTTLQSKTKNVGQVRFFSRKGKTWVLQDFFLHLLRKLCAAKKEVSLKFCSAPLMTFTRMPIPESCWGADMPAVAGPEVTCSSYSVMRLKWKIHPEFTCFPWGKEQELLIRQLMTEELTYWHLNSWTSWGAGSAHSLCQLRHHQLKTKIFKMFGL